MTAILRMATALLAGFTGCGEDDLPKLGVPTYPVSGKVLRKDGSPLPSGLVVFMPEDPKAPRASGPIAPDGTFSLNTDGIAPGAPAGDFKVRIEVDPEAGPGAFGKTRGLPFPAKYAKESTSGLIATVKADETNEFSFSLK